MKKILKVIRNILIGIIMVVYFGFIVAISTLLLNKNDYGVTQFGEKSLILVDETISNKDYPEGTLVILETKKIEDLKAGDEIFIYQPDKKDKSVDIIISDIEAVHLDVDSPYVTITNDGTAWGEDFIAGVKTETHKDLGAFLIFIESKWVFFVLLIMPCFFILLYEVYLLIIAIKFDDDEDEVKETKDTKEDKDDSSDKLEDLARQLEELKKANGEEKKEENIDDLMAQLNSLRQEYDKIEETDTVEEIKEIEKDEVQVAIEQSVTEVIPVVEDIVKAEEVKEEVVEETTVVAEPVKEVVQPKQNNNNKQQNNKQNNNRNNNNRNNNNRNNNNRNNQNNRNNKKNNKNNNRQNNNRNNNNRNNNNKNNRNNQKRK